MKKITIFIIALSTVISFAGCSNSLPANEYSAQNPETADTAQTQTAAQNPDLIPVEETGKKWKEDYERDKVAIDGIVLENPGYNRAEFKYYYIKQNEYGKNQITLEMQVTNLSNMDYSVFHLESDVNAKTVGENSVNHLHDSTLDKPEFFGRSDDVIRAGGTMTVIMSYGLKDLESDVELSLSAESQRLAMRLNSNGERENGVVFMQPETAILKIK